jgi:6-carboxyhexanoate--CoA ligase
MRASRKSKRQIQETSARDSGLLEIHISGAEGMYEEKEVAKIIRKYTLRALGHQKGRPDSVVISLEEIKQRPQSIQSLPVRTLVCRSPLQARGVLRKILNSCGISDRAINTSFAVIDNSNTMRGAALVLSKSGRRKEQDKERGIRASRLGISRYADKILSRNLEEHLINNTTVKEAIILASKVAACREVTAELCISDDPGYTTGYISSKKCGYVRIPNIKKKGQRTGGRVFFIEENADIASVTGFLEKTPVIINSVSPCFGTRTLDEIIDHIDR